MSQRTGRSKAGDENPFESLGKNRRKQIIIALLFFMLPLVFAIPVLRRQQAAWQNNGLQGLSVDGLAVSQDVLFAFSPEGIFRSTDGVRWEARNSGLPLAWWEGISVKTLAVSPGNPSLAYTLISHDTGAPQLYKTRDSGDSWQKVDLPPDSGLIETLALFPGSDRALYVLGSERVYRSEDGGETWEWRGYFPRGVRPQTCSVDADSFETLYLGTRNHGVFVSEDGGRSWHARSQGLSNESVRQLLISPVDHHVVFALAEQGIYRSVDSGRHWQFISSELNGKRVTTITAHPTRVGVVYAGTTEGQVLITADAGENWMNLGTRVADAPVRALILDEGSVRVATHHGLWEFSLDLPPDLTPPSTVVALAPTPTAAATPAPSATPTVTPLPTDTAAPTPTSSATPAPTQTSTATELPPPTSTPLPPPTATPTQSPSATPLPTETATPPPSATPSATTTARPTAGPPTSTATPAPSPSPTALPSPTPPPSITPGGPRPTPPGGTVPPSPTLTHTSTPTITPTVTSTITPTATLEPADRGTPTPGGSLTPTSTSTPSPDGSLTPTSTSTSSPGQAMKDPIVRETALAALGEQQPGHRLTRRSTMIIVHPQGWMRPAPSETFSLPAGVALLTASDSHQRVSG